MIFLETCISNNFCSGAQHFGSQVTCEESWSLMILSKDFSSEKMIYCNCTIFRKKSFLKNHPIWNILLKMYWNAWNVPFEHFLRMIFQLKQEFQIFPDLVMNFRHYHSLEALYCPCQPETYLWWPYFQLSNCLWLSNVRRFLWVTGCLYAKKREPLD